MSISIEMLL